MVILFWDEVRLEGAALMDLGWIIGYHVANAENRWDNLTLERFDG